jgi:hypothetical protein
MGQTTFSGPVRSLGGFYTAGNSATVSLTADTTLTVAAHAGPTIVATAGEGSTNPSQANNIGAQFYFVIETTATDLDILTDGTDKFVGGTYTGVTNNTGKTFISGASNDVITLDGSTKGGLAGSVVQVTAIAAAKYAVTGILLGSGTLVTPFADA